MMRYNYLLLSALELFIKGVLFSCGDVVVGILIEWSGFRSEDEVTDAFCYLLSFIYIF